MTFSKSENKWMNLAQEINKKNSQLPVFVLAARKIRSHVWQRESTYGHTNILLLEYLTGVFFFQAGENGLKWLTEDRCTEKQKIPSECKLIWILVLHLPHSYSIMLLLITLFYFPVHSPLPLPSPQKTAQLLNKKWLEHLEYLQKDIQNKTTFLSFIKPLLTIVSQ